MATDTQEFVSDCGGLASVVDVADFLDLSEEEVRAWAAENEVAVVGGRFIFTAADVEDLRDDVDDVEGDEDEEDADPEDDDSDAEDTYEGDPDDEEE